MRALPRSEASRSCISMPSPHTRRMMSATSRMRVLKFTMPVSVSWRRLNSRIWRAMADALSPARWISLRSLRAAGDAPIFGPMISQ